MKDKTGLRRSWAATKYLVGGCGTAALAIIGWIATPIVLILGLGLPIIPVAVRVLRALTALERRRTARFTGRPIPEYHEPPDGDRYRQSLRLLRSPGTWRDVAWMLFHGCVGLVLALAAIAFWVGIPNALVVPFIWQLVDTSVILRVDSWTKAIVYPPIGIVLYAAALLWLTPRLARFQAWYDERLLGNTSLEAMNQRIEVLTATRAEALDAHGAELRRIERDLHDGTQAQLVTAALRLGLADRRFLEDPEGSRKLMLEARAGVEDALTQLRTVIRGIYPPILSDRGLVGAIRSLAGGRPIPVSVDIPDPERRCPAAVEAAAYFVVAEGLTNVSKHSGASHARISLTHTGPFLRILIRDDGRGGADPAGGSGLAGIRRRVAALDGVTRLDSPVGDGTTLEVDLPCGL